MNSKILLRTIISICIYGVVHYIFMQWLITWLESLAQLLPAPLFVLIGSLVEEVIAPIPSPLVMTLAGSLAASQNQALWYLLVLAVLGAVSKTTGSLIIYVIADKAEDLVINSFGKFLGVSHTETEGLGRFLGQGRRDDIAIFLLRAIPLIPTVPVSVVAGILKINIKTYLSSTFLGLVVRNSIYLYLGYTSVDALESLNHGFESLETIGYLLLGFIAVFAFIWMYRKRQNGSFVSSVDKLSKHIFKSGKKK